MTLEQLVRDPSTHWARRAPASPEAVDRLAADRPTVPADYLAFLALSNGGEGELGIEPCWFQLWPAEEVATLNQRYEVNDFISGYVGFGSNGGNELLAFAPDGRVVMIPFIPMRLDEANEIAPHFLHLATQFGRNVAAV